MIRCLVARLLLLVLLLLLVALPASAREVLRNGELSLDLSGSLRQIAQMGKQTDADDFIAAADANCLTAQTFESCGSFGAVGEKDAWRSFTRLRTRADLELFEGLRAVVVYDHSLMLGILDTFEAELGDSLVRDDLFEADWTITDSDRADWRHLFYRGFVQLEAGGLDLTVGRQRISWGVGRLWNPIDRFSAIPPLAVQSDESQGIDSIDARWSFDGFNFAEVVFAPGSSRGESRYAMRLHGVVLDSDVSLMGGVFAKAPTVGIDFARNLGDAAFRAELVYTHPESKVWKLSNFDRSGPEKLDDYFQLVASLDYTFDVADGIYVLVEHLYNGNALGFGSGDAGVLLGLFEATNDAPEGVPPGLGPYVMPGRTALFGGSRVITFSENQTGGLLGGDITPELRLEFLSIYDWEGESAAFFPSLKYTPGGSVEVTLGVQTFAGPRRSQYGDGETFVYLLADFFF